MGVIPMSTHKIRCEANIVLVVITIVNLPGAMNIWKSYVGGSVGAWLDSVTCISKLVYNEECFNEATLYLYSWEVFFC